MKKKMRINELEKEIERLSKEIDSRESDLKDIKNEQLTLKAKNEEGIAIRTLKGLYSSKDEELVKKRGKIISKIKSMKDDEKLIVGRFVYNHRLINGCGEFGSYKNPTTCSGCHDGENNVSEFGLEKYVKFLGDRVYKIPSEVFDEALSRLSSRDIKVKEKTLESKIKPLCKSIKKLERDICEKKDSIGIYKELEKNGADYKKVNKLMPDFIEFAKDWKKKGEIKFMTAKPNEGIGIILIKERHYYGSGGCEYGVNVIAFRNGHSQSSYFKWRDAYNSNNDVPEWNFQKAKIFDVTNEGFHLSLKSWDDNSEGYIARFFLKKRKNHNLLERKLNKEDQEKFRNKFKTIENELINKHYKKDGVMPAYIDLSLPPGASSRDHLISYKKPEIVDRFIVPEKRQGVLILKAQIDHMAGRGLQYEWVAYKVTRKDIELLERDCAYQYEFKHGKRIDMRARDFLSEET